MRYFNNLNEEKKSVFYRLPQSFHRSSHRETLAYALGATLYMPATREIILADLLSEKLQGLKSMVICLEDAVGDLEVKKAEVNLINQLTQLIKAKEEGLIDEEEIPLIFIRIRNLHQMKMVIENFGENPLLTGFVFPKFTVEKGYLYLEALKEMNIKYNRNLFAMPILEDKNVIYKEDRFKNLQEMKMLFDEFKSMVLNIRIGATDFCSFFGLRRGMETTIYDVAVIRNCIEDVVNIFSRMENDYVVSGCVWEYYSSTKGSNDLFSRELQGLIKEIILDKQNALLGKTIIHPSQILPVQALQVVSQEEYLDACKIISNSEENNGVINSQYGNKMNEVKPHLNWAKKIIKRGEIYGVFNQERSYIDLLK